MNKWVIIAAATSVLIVVELCFALSEPGYYPLSLPKKAVLPICVLIVGLVWFVERVILKKRKISLVAAAIMFLLLFVLLLSSGVLEGLHFPTYSVLIVNLLGYIVLVLRRKMRGGDDER